MNGPDSPPELSERMRRQVERLLDEADEATRALDWNTVRARARAALALDPNHPDGRHYLAVSERQLANAGSDPAAMPFPRSKPTGGSCRGGDN